MNHSRLSELWISGFVVTVACVTCIARAEDIKFPKLEVDSATSSSRSVQTQDSSAIFLMDFLRRAGEDATTCKAETPLIAIGSWGIHAYPVPYYQEEHGWEAGSMASLLRGGPIESQYAFSVMSTYGEREDKLQHSASLKIGTAVGKRLELSSTVRASNRHGRRGLIALLGLYRTDPGRRTWMSIGLLVGHETLKRIQYLSPSEWEIGERSMAGVRFIYDDFGRDKPMTFGLQSEINALTEQNVLGGDFVSRKISAELRVASARGMFWASGGSIDGRTPIQDLFDLAVDGGIRAGAIREYQTPSFWAYGIEGRIRIPIDLFALPYLSVSGGRGIEENLLEFGIGFNDSPKGSEFAPTNWFFRLDFPLYSNARLESSRRAKWDLRRIMVRVNLPLDLLSRQEEIRYRYPNR